MDFLEFVSNYFTQSVMARIIEHRAPVNSQFFREAFPNSDQRATSVINIQDLVDKTNTVPVISRGGQSIPVSGKKGTMLSIEPLSIKPSDLLTAAQLNDLRTLYGMGNESGQSLVQLELDRIIKRLMEIVDRTKYAIASQALTGKIDFMMEANGSKERYEISYGQTNSVTVSSTPTKITDIYTLLEEMEEKINEEGFSGNTVVFAGRKAYNLIYTLITATDESKRLGATLHSTHIEINGYIIKPVRTTYNDKDVSGADAIKDDIDRDSLCMCIPSFNEVIYAALDDIDAGLQPLPFFAKTVKQEDPSAIKVIGECKPLPFAPPKSICWSKIIIPVVETETKEGE